MNLLFEKLLILCALTIFCRCHKVTATGPTTIRPAAINQTIPRVVPQTNTSSAPPQAGNNSTIATALPGAPPRTLNNTAVLLNGTSTSNNTNSTSSLHPPVSGSNTTSPTPFNATTPSNTTNSNNTSTNTTSTTIKPISEVVVNNSTLNSTTPPINTTVTCKPGYYYRKSKACSPCKYGSDQESGYSTYCPATNSSSHHSNNFKFPLRFSAMTYTDALANSSSTEYAQFKAQILVEMNTTFEKVDGFEDIVLLDLSNGSVIAEIGVQVKGDVTGGALVSAKQITTALEAATRNGTFAGQQVDIFHPIDLTQQGSLDLTHVFPGSSCAVNSDCSRYNQNALCKHQRGVGLCTCDVLNGYYLNDNKTGCEMYVHHWQPCMLGYTKCVDPNTVCGYDNQLNGINRCMCSPGYHSVHTPEGDKCGHKINEIVDPQCSNCIKNEGHCYDLNNDLKKDGCSCPVSRTGNDCEHIHAHVSCLVSNKTLSMKVCYNPHPGVDLSQNGYYMYTSGRRDQMHCRGRPPLHGECDPQATSVLTLSLANDRLDGCNVKNFTQTNAILYESRIVVERHDASVPYIFDTYCKYSTSVQAVTGVGTVGISNSQAGTSVLPKLVFEPRHSNGMPVENGDTVRTTDKLAIHAYLENDINYGALSVTSCIFTTSPTTPVPNYAESVSAYDKGCPTDSGTFGAGSQFLPFRDQPNYLVSNKVKIPIFSNSLTHMHCVLKVCLNNERDQCTIPKCDGSSYSGRKKRASGSSAPSTNHFMVSKSMNVRESHEEDIITVSAGQIGVISGIVGSIVLILIVSTIVLVLLVIKKRKDTGGYSQGGPIMYMRQRFFKPRINAIA